MSSSSGLPFRLLPTLASTPVATIPKPFTYRALPVNRISMPTVQTEEKHDIVFIYLEAFRAYSGASGFRLTGQTLAKIIPIYRPFFVG